MMGERAPSNDPMGGMSSETLQADAGLLVNRAKEAERKGTPELALALYRQALSCLDASADPLAADIIRWQGTVHRERGESDEACLDYERSLRLSEELHYTSGCAHALNCLGIVAQRRGDLNEAMQLYDEASKLAAAAGDHRLAG